MTASIIFAVSSMFSAGLNDLLFKQYVPKDRPRRIYIALTCFFCLIFLTLFLISYPELGRSVLSNMGITQEDMIWMG